jgi:hypothetical protein
MNPFYTLLLLLFHKNSTGFNFIKFSSVSYNSLISFFSLSSDEEINPLAVLSPANTALPDPVSI